MVQLGGGGGGRGEVGARRKLVTIEEYTKIFSSKLALLDGRRGVGIIDRKNLGVESIAGELGGSIEIK